MKLILLLGGTSIPNVVFSEVMKEVPKPDFSDRIDEIIIHGPNRYDVEFINRVKSLFPNALLTYRKAHVGSYTNDLARWEDMIRDDIRYFDFHQYFVVITFVNFPHSVWCAYGHSSNYTDDAYILAASGIIRESFNFRRIRIPVELRNR